MLLPSSNPSLKSGPHLPVMAAVVGFTPAHIGHDLRIKFGPQVVCDSALILHKIAVQYASLFQFVECDDNLLKGTVNDSPCLVHVSFHLFQFHVVCSHCLYPIGNHVSHRIQAFSRNDKRGYLYSLRQKVAETQASKGLDSKLHGRAYRHRKGAHLQSGNRKERSGVTRSAALLAAGLIIQEGHRQLNVRHEVGINVRPFGRGSFVVEIVLFVKSNWPLLSLSAVAMNDAIQNTTQVLETIGMIRSRAESVISVIKKLRGKPETVEQIKPGEYRYSGQDASVTVNGNVHTLLQNPVIHAQVVQVFGKPVEQEGVTELDIYLKNRRDETEVKITKADAPVFHSFSESKIPDPEPVKEIDTPPAHYLLHPKRLSAEGEPNGWSFRWGKDILTIDKILDKSFLEKVRSGEYRLSSNDLIDAEIVVKQKVSGTRIVSETKEIVRVAEYKSAPPNPQTHLFLPPTEG